MRYLLGLSLLFLVGCTTTEVRTSNDFYFGCMNGAISRHALGGRQVTGEDLKFFHIICKKLEVRYEDAVRRAFEPPPRPRPPREFHDRGRNI